MTNYQSANQPFTYQSLCEEAKNAKAEYTNTNLPVVQYHYFDFAEKTGIDLEQLYSIQKFIKEISYDDKRRFFEAMGFKVLFMTLSIVKIGHKVRDAATPDAVSLEDQFLNNERNVFIFSVEHGITDSIYFLLEYPVTDGETTLADHTVDREQLAIDKAKSIEMRNLLFGRNRK